MACSLWLVLFAKLLCLMKATIAYYYHRPKSLFLTLVPDGIEYPAKSSPRKKTNILKENYCLVFKKVAVAKDQPNRK